MLSINRNQFCFPIAVGQSAEEGAVQAAEGVPGRVGGGSSGVGPRLVARYLLPRDGRGLRAGLHHPHLTLPDVPHILVQLHR